MELCFSDGDHGDMSRDFPEIIHKVCSSGDIACAVDFYSKRLSVMMMKDSIFL